MIQINAFWGARLRGSFSQIDPSEDEFDLRWAASRRHAGTSTFADMTTGSRNTLKRRAAASSNRHHWKIQFGEGLILVMLGCAAVFVPFWFGAAIVTWLILIAGITGLITTLIMWRARGSWWSLASAVSAIAVASVMITIPALAIVAFPLLLMTFLVLEGIVTILLALEHWRDFSARWGWMLASGIVDLALAAFIVIGLPSTASWALGLILAVNLVFGGGAMIGMALAERTRLSPAHPAPDVA